MPEHARCCERSVLAGKKVGDILPAGKMVTSLCLCHLQAFALF